MGVKDNITVKHPYPIHTKEYGISNINTHYNKKREKCWWSTCNQKRKMLYKWVGKVIGLHWLSKLIPIQLSKFSIVCVHSILNTHKSVAKLCTILMFLTIVKEKEVSSLLFYHKDNPTSSYVLFEICTSITICTMYNHRTWDILILWICLGFAYFDEIKNFLLKIL